MDMLVGYVWLVVDIVVMGGNGRFVDKSGYA